MTGLRAVEAIQRAFARTPAVQAGGESAVSMAAALWRVEAGRVELTSEPLPDTHIISLATTGKHHTTYYGDSRLRFAKATGPGNFNIVPAGEKPRVIQQSLDEAVEYLHLYIPHAQLLRLAADELERDADVALVDPLAIRDPVAFDLGRRVLAEARSGLPLAKAQIDAFCISLCVHLLRHHSSISAQLGPRYKGRLGRSDWRLRRAIDFIEAHSFDDISLVAVANAADVSLRHLGSLFVSATGEPPHRYIMDRRLENACRMLRDRSRTVTEVALACGFASSQHFATVFRRRLGTTPSAWRKDHFS